MKVNVNPPPRLKIPDKFFQDPDLRSFFEQQKQILFQLWNRTGGQTDLVEDFSDHENLANIGTNTHPQIDAHLALTDEHIDWTQDQGTTNIDPGNYIDTDTDDHEDLTNIGTRTHAQIDEHLVWASTTELEDITDAINTDAEKILGYMVRNSTTGATVFASGSTDGAVWHFYDSSIAHTPI